LYTGHPWADDIIGQVVTSERQHSHRVMVLVVNTRNSGLSLCSVHGCYDSAQYDQNKRCYSDFQRCTKYVCSAVFYIKKDWNCTSL